MELDHVIVEALAIAIHHRYRDRQESVYPRWDLLPENFRAANRAQARDIRRKLRLLGYAVTDQPDSVFVVDSVELDRLAEREHERWCAERVEAGWTWGPERDPATRRHPCLVGWDLLPEHERQKDRDVVAGIVDVLAVAGLGVTRRVVVDQE